MLCDESEVDNVSYFPKMGKQKIKYGKYKVECLRVKQHRIKNVTWRIFKVFEGKSMKYQLTHHLAMTGWSKNGIPKNPFDVIGLSRWVKNMSPQKAPICVHCDCGVGRSTTFVALDYAQARIEQGSKMDEIAKELRGMRHMAIETREQYLALHVWLLEYFNDEGLIDDVPKDEFMEKLKRAAVIPASTMA